MPPKGAVLRSGLKLRNFLVLFVAGVVNAFGVNVFFYPVGLYDSGVSGTSMLLDQVTAPNLQLWLFLLVLNIPIFLFGLRRQGLPFTVYSLFAIAVYSFFSYLIVDVLPVDVSGSSPLAQNDLLLCALFGGLLSGVGSGITIRNGGALDGIDVLSVMYAKRLGVSLGTFVMAFNTVLYVVCGIVMQSWVLPLYSIVAYFVGSKTVDYITEGFDHAKSAMIVTTKAQEIAAALSRSFEASGTIVGAQGGYSLEQKQVLYFVVNKFQVYKLREIVFDIDPQAFISLQDVSDIIKHEHLFGHEEQIASIRTE